MYSRAITITSSPGSGGLQRASFSAKSAAAIAFEAPE